MYRIIAVSLVMIACSLQTVGAQEQERNPKVVVIHVTSVERVDNSAACKTDRCSAVRYRVEGYADAESNAMAIQYVIACDEFSSDVPIPHRNNICARFHAGSAYTAYVQSDSVSFPFSKLNKNFEADYSIVSEKEVARGPGQQDSNGGSEQREATRGPEKRQPAKGPEQLASKISN